MSNEASKGEYKTITVVHEGPVARVSIARAEKLNALNAQVIAELTDAFTRIETDSSVRVAVLSGTGEKAFAAGADIAEMAGMNTEQARSFSRAGHLLGERIEGLRVPVIAKVKGFALGGGCELAMCADLIYASDTAKFGQPEVSLGVIPGFGGTQRLARRVGIGRARELVLRGHVIDAETAARIGLAEAVFALAEIDAKVDEIARQIAAQAPLAVGQAKRVMRGGADVPLVVANELEAQGFSMLFGTEDQKRGMRAFVQNPKAPRSFEGN